MLRSIVRVLFVSCAPVLACVLAGCIADSDPEAEDVTETSSAIDYGTCLTAYEICVEDCYAGDQVKLASCNTDCENKREQCAYQVSHPVRILPE